MVAGVRESLPECTMPDMAHGPSSWYGDLQQNILDGLVPVETVLRLIREDSDAMAVLVAATHPQLPTDVIQGLACHPDPWRRAAAAGAPAADTATLDRLRLDVEESVVLTVALNEHTSATTLKWLWDERPQLREALTSNHSLPPDCLHDVPAESVSDAVALLYISRTTPSAATGQESTGRQVSPEVGLPKLSPR